MPPETTPSADDPPAGLTHEERKGAAARAVELVALTLAADPHTGSCNNPK